MRLVGLTLDPGVPGVNTVLVYLLPIEGPGAAARPSPSLRIGTRDLPLASCASTCRRTTAADLSSHERVTVHVAGASGGDARFELPELPAPDSSVVLALAQRRMHQLRTYRIDEALSSGTATVPITYAFQVPDRLQSSSG